MSFTILLVLLLQTLRTATASSFALYSDSNCSDVLQNVAANNAYPSGSCTNFKEQAGSTFESFMFLTLDDGCSITVYEPDTSSLSCSGHAVLGSLNTCYNSSWDYYSVDECTVPTLLAATLSATATSSTAAATSTSASATASGAAGQAGAGGLSLSAGGLVGVVLGCTVGTAALLVGAFMLLRRRRSTSGRAAAAAAVAGAGSTPSVEQVQKAPPSGGGGGGGSGMSPGLSDWRMAPGYSAGSSSTMEQRGAGATYGKWHEVSEQGLAEAAYDSHFPVSRNVELPAEPAPNELSSHRYH